MTKCMFSEDERRLQDASRKDQSEEKSDEKSGNFVYICAITFEQRFIGNTWQCALLFLSKQCKIV